MTHHPVYYFFIFVSIPTQHFLGGWGKGWHKVSYSPDWPQDYYVHRVTWKSWFFSFQSPKCWNDRCVSPYPTLVNRYFLSSSKLQERLAFIVVFNGNTVTWFQKRNGKSLTWTSCLLLHWILSDSRNNTTDLQPSFKAKRERGWGVSRREMAGVFLYGCVYFSLCLGFALVFLYFFLLPFLSWP